MEEPMVTISLEEYNKLRDMADFNKLLMDKIMFFETRMIDIDRRIFDVECKIK